jgi:hypothetical protein
MSTASGRISNNHENAVDRPRPERRFALAAGIAGVLIGCAGTLAVVGLRDARGRVGAADQAAGAAGTAGSAAADPTELAALQQESAQLRRTNQQLSAAVADLRAASEKHKANNDPLARATPDRQSERKAAPAPAAESDKWAVLFRADDPSAWDTPSYTAEKWGVPLHLVPEFRYLRLRRMDTGETLILALTRDQLRNDKPPHPDTGYWWNGTATLAWEGRHLGIVQGPRYKFPVPNGMICVMTEGWDGFAGSGFGHKAFVNKEQCYCWHGREIPKTVFEIAVTSGPLSAAEEQFVVGGP